MTNDINFLTGINDSHLIFDHPRFSVDSVGNKVIHLIQSFPMHCPVCGHLMKRNGLRTKPVIIRILSLAGEPTILSIKKQKYICKPSAFCPKVITKLAPVQGIDKGCRIANLVKHHITMCLNQNISQTDIAKNHFVSPNTVTRMLDSLEDNFRPNRHWLPSAIAFDDFSSGKFATNGMSMILMNPVNHRTIDIIQSRNTKCLRNYFLCRYSAKARRAVRLVVVDLFQPYRKVIHDLFPHAVIIADHFHIVVQAYRALQAIRIQVMNQYGTGTHEYRALKHFWKLLVMKVDKLDFVHYYRRHNFGYRYLSNSEVIDRLLAFSDDLKVAYDYYQDVINAVDNANEDLFDQLINQKITTLPEKLQKVHRTLRNHQNEIKDSFKCHLTNGPIEGTNNKIKVIKRTAYGFRNFFHFRIRILMSLKNSNLMIKAIPKEKASPSSFAA